MRDGKSKRRDRQKQNKANSKLNSMTKEDPEKPSKATTETEVSQKWDKVYEKASGKMTELMAKTQDQIQRADDKEKRKKNKVKGENVKKFKLGKKF